MAENSNPSSITPNPVQPFVAETNIKPSGQDTKPVEDSSKLAEEKLKKDLAENTDETAEKSFKAQDARIDAALENAGVSVPKETSMGSGENKSPGIEDLLKGEPTALEERISQQLPVSQSSAPQEPVQAEKVE